MVDLAEQGHAVAVLGIIASVLGQLDALDNMTDDPTYWRQVVVNLNVLADTVQRKELDNESLFDDVLSEDDWDLSEHLLNDEAGGGFE
jgi:hypothetical protein